jgi:hypothetical protein
MQERLFDLLTTASFDEMRRQQARGPLAEVRGLGPNGASQRLE